MPTAIIIDHEANISMISGLQEHVSNTLASTIGRWMFEYKLYKVNAGSLPNTRAGQASPGGSWQGSFLYTIQFSHLPGQEFCVIDDTVTVLGEGDFDGMLATKLKSLWILRQTIKAEGHCYEVKMNSTKVILRLANMFVQGGYKGLVVEVEWEDEEANQENEKARYDGAKDFVRKVLKQYGLEYKGERVSFSSIDTARMYIDALRS